MSLPKIVYAVKVSHVENDGKWGWEKGNPILDISLFYKKEMAENFARGIVIEELEGNLDCEERLIKANNMSWELMEKNIDEWFKYTPFLLNIEIEEMEIN